MQEKKETQIPSLSQEDPLEKEMATHFSILAWRISWTEEPGSLQRVSQSQTLLKQLSTHTLWKIEEEENGFLKKYMKLKEGFFQKIETIIMPCMLTRDIQLNLKKSL